jgi:osmotically-inducible protein OsmY
MIVLTNGFVPRVAAGTNPLAIANQQLLSTNAVTSQFQATNSIVNSQFPGTNTPFPATNDFDRDDWRFRTNGFDRDDWQHGTNESDRDDWRFGHTNDLDRDDFRHTNGFGGFSNRFGIFTNSSSTNPYNVIQSPGTNGFRGDIARTPQDAALLLRVRARLAPERRDGRMIRLSAQNGVVTISGAVPSPEEAQEFVALAQQTPGVVSVVNNLNVVPGLFSHGGFGQDRGFTPADQRLLGQVRRHMHQQDQMQGGVSESVHILAQNGVVTLVGFVSSVDERQALEAAVQSTPGVVQVIDQLQVRAGIDQNGAPAVGGSTQFGGGASAASGGGGSFSPVQQASPSGSGTNEFETNAAPTTPR